MRTWLISLITKLLRWWLGRRSAPPLPAAPRSVLIVKPCCVGDVLLTTPLVAAIRGGYPNAEITYAVGRWSQPMVANNPHVDRVLVVPDRWTFGSLLAVGREIRSRRLAIAFVPERSPLLTLLLWLARVPARVGLDSAGRGFAYTHPVSVPSFPIHEADLYNLLASAAGLDQPPHRLFFTPSRSAQATAKQLVDEIARDKPLIVLHPGGGQNPGMTLPRKRWLPGRWAAVADTLARDGSQLLIVGGPGEEDVVAAVRSAMREPAEAIVRRWDWDELGALIKQSSLFLGHDTGMMHLATAVGTPTLAVFGPSDPQMYGPYSDRGAYVWRPTAQSPCFLNGIAVSDCSCAMQCMRNVTTIDVLQAARRLLAGEKVD